MLKHLLVLTCALLASSSALAQVMARDLGDFELKLATSPPRSMAQGLVTPGSSGSFHGGLDLSHESGWYIGNWTSNLDPGKPTAIASYAGFKRPLNHRLGYEMGLIRYSRPEQPANAAAELSGGLSIFGSRLGAALSSDRGRNDTTLFADLGVNPPFGFDVTLKYGNHRLDNPASLSGGGYVSVFNDWSVNLSRPWLGIDLNLSYSGTSLTGSDCSAYSGHNSYCDTTFMLKASRPFF
ncbi:hypothetical protein GHU28_00720 [Pseudomonas aeruginosa]|nr:hypothetical protein [Pseudomonas aeruginosa]